MQRSREGAGPRPAHLRALSWTTLAVMAASGTAAAVEVPGVGWEGQGAGIEITNLDADPRPDLILMAYDNPAQANNFRYRVGRNVDANGVTADWTAGYIRVDGVGWEGQGAGLAVTNLDADARPELILMAYDAPAGANNFRYKIGWNLGPDGVASRWDAGFQMVPGVGWEGQGADLVVTNLDDDPRPDMILMAYDAPGGANNFRYKVGWNLNAAGVAARWDAGFFMVDGVGWEGQGAGMAVASLDADPRPELLLMAYDNPARANDFRWKVGWNLDASGRAQRWDPGFRVVPGLGWEGAGAGLAVGNLDSDPRPDLIFMAYDDPPQANNFRYVVRLNEAVAQNVWLEMDKLTAVAWPPASAVRGGRSFTLSDIYWPLGFAIDVRQHEAAIADPLPGACFSDADLDNFRATRMNDPPPAGSTAWHMHAAIVDCHTDGILGIMYDTAQRRGFAVFMGAFGGDQARILRTTAHELGHALCLYHSDGDAWRPGGPATGQGRTIMNQTGQLAGDWGYAWSAGSTHKVLDRSKRRWAPRSGFGFGVCH